MFQLGGSYAAVFCGVTCHRAQRQQHFVATRLRKSDAPLVRAVYPTEHESSRANLRPCRAASKGEVPQRKGGGDNGQGCLVICKCVGAPMVACRDVCEEIRARGDAVQLEGSSMRDVADFVGW